jgi:hypothetical protein
VREHFGDSKLVYLSWPAAFGVLLPLAPVPAGAQQQLAQVRRSSLRASGKYGICWRYLSHGLLE